MSKNNQIINLSYPLSDMTTTRLSKVLSGFSSCDSYTNASYIDGRLLTFYNSLGDTTKTDITDISSHIELLGITLKEYVETCKNIDEVKYGELQKLINELYDSSSQISNYSDLIGTHEFDDEINEIKIAIINKLGLNDSSDEARQLRKDIDQFIFNYKKENNSPRDNIEILKYFTSKIPDNYKKYEEKCKWNSVPLKSVDYRDCNSYCEWFDIDGVKIRLSEYVDKTTSYPSIQLLFNRVYCYNIINNMKTWDPNYMRLLKKREYIDVVVADAEFPPGAAAYFSCYPYLDYILLPTTMNGIAYESDDKYNYLSECLVHEMSHYADGIVGLSYLKEYDYEHISQSDKDFYSHVESLIDDKYYEIQLINKHGEMSDQEKENFVHLKDQPDKSFDENFAEFLRADLVDHDKFVQVIGQEEYDNLFNRLNTMNRRSEDGYNYVPEITGDNRDVTIYKEKDGVREIQDTVFVYDNDGKKVGEKGTNYIEEYQYKGNVITKTTREIYDLKPGEQISIYYDNGNVKTIDEVYKDGSEYHYKYREDGTLEKAHLVNEDGESSYIYYDANGKEIAS